MVAAKYSRPVLCLAWWNARSVAETKRIFSWECEKRMKAKLKNEANLCLEKHLRELHVRFEAEYPFARIIGRRWKFDYFLPEYHLGIEINGGIWTRGRHTRGKGFQEDMMKKNHATMLRYRVLEFSTEDVERGRAKAFLLVHLVRKS